MKNKKYVCLMGTDYTEFIKIDEDVKLFKEMVETQKRTKGVPLKDCYKDVVKALQIERRLKGGDPNTVVIAKTLLEGLAKLRAFSKTTQN